MSGEYTTAMTNRSLRTIKAELEFLTDASILTPNQLTSLLEQLPGPVPLHAPVSVAPAAVAQPQQPLPTPQMANLSVNGNGNARQTNGNPPAPSPAPTSPPQSPPAYPTAPLPPVPSALAYAIALYAYTPTDAGDLALSPQDRVAVTEYMNAEWWKGRSERTGKEGIFPRAYVRVEEKPAAPPRTPSNYGNVPMDVSQSAGGSTTTSGVSKEHGKKFGRKLGNAAIFGAGATIGSSIVSGIL